MLCAIIGAGAGLSAGIARRFRREGFDVALVSRRAPLSGAEEPGGRPVEEKKI